jgi:hypothetical protein
MVWQPLDSKMFISRAYDVDKRILYLRFRSGEVYRYFEFSAERNHEFLGAESRGRYFLSHVRNHFRYERLTRLQAA